MNTNRLKKCIVIVIKVEFKKDLFYQKLNKVFETKENMIYSLIIDDVEICHSKLQTILLLH